MQANSYANVPAMLALAKEIGFTGWEMEHHGLQDKSRRTLASRAATWWTSFMFAITSVCSSPIHSARGSATKGMVCTTERAA